MKRLAAIAVLMVFCLFLNLWAAEETVSFSGTWIHDVKKSEPFPRFIMDMSGPPVSDVSRGGGGGFPGGGMGGGFPGGGFGGPGGGMGGPGAAKAPQQPQQLPPMAIEQTDSEMRITSSMKGMDGKEMPLVESYKLDGKELVETLPGMAPSTQIKKKTKVTLKKDKFQVHVETAAPPPQGTSSVKKEYSLSKDGKILTMEISNSSAFGRSVQKLVYNKQ